MEEERNSLAAERRNIREELLVMQDERLKNSAERQHLQEDKVTLQSNLNTANKVCTDL